MVSKNTVALTQAATSELNEATTVFTPNYKENTNIETFQQNYDQNTKPMKQRKLKIFNRINKIKPNQASQI